MWVRHFFYITHGTHTKTSECTFVKQEVKKQPNHKIITIITTSVSEYLDSYFVEFARYQISVLQMVTHASRCPALMEDFAKMESAATAAFARLGTKASTVKLVQKQAFSRFLQK